jgi:hypothetical protein
MRLSGIHAFAIGLLVTTSAGCPDSDATPPADTGATDSTASDAGSDTATAPDTVAVETMDDTHATDTPNTDDTATPADTSPIQRIGWCITQFPPFIDAAPGASSGPVYGRVFVAGITDGADQGDPKLEGQLGFAPDDGTATFPDGWTWVDGADARKVDANREFEASFTTPSNDGTYRYAWRFRYDNGPWVSCDRNGTDDGFDAGDTGVLTVRTPLPEWCRVQFPTDPIAIVAGETTPVLYGRVFAPGRTGDGHDGAANIVSEVGFGPRGSVPDDSWTWIPGTFHMVVDNGIDGQRTNDEHRATLTPPAGTWDWAWRFRIAGFDVWRTCDTVGNPTYQPAAAARLDVTPAPSR